MSEILQFSLFGNEQDCEQEKSRSSRAVRPASRSALLETAALLTMSVICGPNTSEPFAKSDPSGAWARTFGGFLQQRMDGTFEEYSGSLPTLGIAWRGALYELATQELPINGSASALWPTPRANCKTGPSSAPKRQGSEDLQTAVLWSTPAAQDSKNSTLPPSQVKRDTLPGDIIRELWATPTAGAKGMTSCNTGRPPGEKHQPGPPGADKRELGDPVRGGCGRSGRRRDGQEPENGHLWERRTAQSGLGGLFDGISSRLDAQRWPAPKGQKQFDWEPPRTGYGIPDRAPRLTGDGNAVVPQQFYPVLAFIAAYERGELDP